MANEKIILPGDGVSFKALPFLVEKAKATGKERPLLIVSATPSQMRAFIASVPKDTIQKSEDGKSCQFSHPLLTAIIEADRPEREVKAPGRPIIKPE